MKKYYVIKESVENDIGSSFPQAQRMSSGYNYKAPDSIYAVSHNRGERITFEPNLNSIMVQGNAKMTDIMSVAALGGWGLFVSGRLKEILLRFNLCQHQFFKCQFIHRKKEYDNYYWLHISSNFTRQVDYEHSIFYLPVEGFGFEHDLVFKGFSEYVDFIDKNDKFGLLRAKKTSLKLSDIGMYDMFVVSDFDQSIYISDELKNEIANQKLTGVRIQEADKLSLI